MTQVVKTTRRVKVFECIWIECNLNQLKEKELNQTE